jgi:replicative DNA helicase
MARELQVPVLVLAPVLRSAEMRRNHRPILADLRDAETLAADAEAILFLYREDYYFPDSEQKGLASVILAKNREGPTGEVQLAFRKEIRRFENLRRTAPE